LIKNRTLQIEEENRFFVKQVRAVAIKDTIDEDFSSSFVNNLSCRRSPGEKIVVVC